MKAAQILLVEDNPGDVRLTLEAIKEADVTSNTVAVNTGLEALRYLRAENEYQEAALPDLILLDLNMPKMDGRELLKIIKVDPKTHAIPVIVLSTSQSKKDIQESYDLQANCYISKPADMDEFVGMVRCIERFWLRLAARP